MRKSIVWFVLGATLFAPFQVFGEYNPQNATAYLQAHLDNPWTAMALKSLGALEAAPDFLKSVSGTSAIQLAAPILAIAAFGQDPRTFGDGDLVRKLKSYHSGGQIGDDSTINDDIFGLLALIAANEGPNDAVFADAKNFITGHQQENGGWGFAISGGADSNMTAAAIVSLIASGTLISNPAIQKGLAYLKIAQNEDGGFTYDPQSALGTASDSSSTAWVIWALTASGVNPETWTKAGNSPNDYLKTMQATQGYFRYQENSGEDAFSPITTAYAVIALAGRTLPLHKLSATRKFDFRIEGKNETVCSGQAPGRTALDVVRNASSLCVFSYHIQDTSFGPYLNQINDDKAEGLIGWIYLVNDILPARGAADYEMQTDDELLWFYGDFNWSPARLTLSASSIEKNGAVQATIEGYFNNTWKPLPGATVFFGTKTAITDANGKTYIAPAEGTFRIFAEKSGYIRTNSQLLRVGSVSGNQLNLSVEITDGKVEGSTLSFLVTPSALDFGQMARGQNSQRSFLIKNTGTVDIAIESMISGDEFFSGNLKLDDRSWRSYKSRISAGQTQDANAELSVPADYEGSLGIKAATLTFWATNQ